MTAAPAVRRSEAVCFRIDGEWLTDHCRGLVTEGRWRLALSTLMDGLPGISADEVFSVLKGTHKLLGVNEVIIVPEDRAEVLTKYHELIRYQFGGLWLRPGRELWQPYAIVTHLGSEDLPSDVGSRDRERWGRRRILHYADDPANDLSTDLRPPGDFGLAVLWRRVQDPPPWIDGHRDSADALTKFKALGRGLQERGADLDAPSLWSTAARAMGLIAGHSGPGDVLIDGLGLSGKMAEAAHAVMDTSDPITPEPPQLDTALCSESGYILTNGDFYGCKYMQHPRLAANLLHWLYDVQVDDPQIEADRRNWLRIQASVTGGFNIMSPKNRPTAAQKRALVDWCIAHEQPYPQDLA